MRTRRRPFTLQVAGEEVAEVALDDTVITVGPDEQPVRLRRVEVEVVPSWVDALRPLVEDLRRSCGLQPATLSKFEAGLLALGVEVPGLPDLGPTEVTPESNLGDLALAVIRVHIGVLLAREPGTRLGEDIEELHDMRVATRRLRAAIDFFVDALPVRAQTFRSELTWLAGVLGNVRDLDVQIDRLDEMDEWVTAGVAADGGDGGSPLEELRILLAAQRAWARRDLLDALDSSRWERLTSGLVAMVQPVPRRRTPAARQPATAVLPDLVTSRHRAVMKAARRARRSGQAPDFHRLRIRCKRLRYSLEFTAGVYGGRTERFTRKLAKLQDALGLMQDAEVATARLLALATSAGAGGPDRLPPRTVFAMGAVAERYRVESTELLTQMPRRLAVLQGVEWRDLATHMVSRRLQTLATVPAPRPVQALGVAVPETADRTEPAGWRGTADRTEPPATGAAGPVPAAPAVPPAVTVVPPAAQQRVPPDAPLRFDPTEPDTVRAVPTPAEPVVPTPGSAPSPAAAALSAWPDSAWGPPRPGGWPVAPPPAGTPAGPGTGTDADKDAGNDEYHRNGSAAHRPAGAHPTGTDGG